MQTYVNDKMIQNAKDCPNEGIIIVIILIIQNGQK